MERAKTIDFSKHRNRESGLLAGVAKADITTDAEGVKINDPLYVRALVLRKGSFTVVIIAMDALAIGGIGDIKDDFLFKLRHRIETELNVNGQNVVVNASHTHPPGRRLCNDEEQIERTFRVVAEALENLTEVKVGVGRGYESRISMNRNLRLNDGSYWTVRQAYPCPPEEQVRDVGPIDPEIGILRIDKLDGTPFAVVYNFACHPLLGVPAGGITADFPGFASQLIEANWGDSAMAFFLQGAAGDIIHPRFKDVKNSRDAEHRGILLGLSTLKALKDITTGDAELNVITEEVELPRKTDFPERINELLIEQEKLLRSLRATCLNFKSFLPLYLKHLMSPQYPSDDSYRYLHAKMIGDHDLTDIDAINQQYLAKYLDNIYAMERLARIQEELGTLKKHQEINVKAGSPTITAEIVGVRIGDFILITAPFEALVEIGLRIKKSSPHEYTFMAAYTNGYMHYGAPVSEYDKGAYEVFECLLDREWQEIYELKALDIIKRL